MAFRKTVRIYFDQGDPANITFHGQHSLITQRVMEEYICELGIPWDEWFMNKDFFFPVVQINNTYLQRVFPGREYLVDVRVVHVGKSSLACHYKILTLEEEICYKVDATYVCVNREPFEAIPIPEKWAKILKSIEEPNK